MQAARAVSVLAPTGGETPRIYLSYGTHNRSRSPLVLAAIIRLFALRPFLTLAILGIPVIVLIAVGLVTIVALKFIVLIVLPIVVVVWVVRKFFGRPDTP